MKNSKIVGFTLMELLISVAIVGILASVAYPSYVDFVARSNRTEALSELLRYANMQEQYYVDTKSYAETMKAFGSTTNDLTTDSENYKITVNITTSGYKLTATAQGSQATNDSSCGTLSVTETGIKSPLSCWN